MKQTNNILIALFIIITALIIGLLVRTSYNRQGIIIWQGWDNPLYVTPVYPFGGPCDCAGEDLDCASFDSQQDAQMCFMHCGGLGHDVFLLDSATVGEVGLACEGIRR